MRHRRAVKKFGRNTAGRKALMRSLLRNLLISERIKTGYVKAKEVSSLADRLISLGKKNTTTSKKTAIEILGSKELINRLFDEIAPRYAGRNGGYTRVLQLIPRRGDGSKMGLLELTERKVIEKSPVKKSPKKETEEKKKSDLEKKKEKKPAAKEEKTASPAPQKEVPETAKDKIEEEKAKELAKSEKEKIRKGFFKDIRRYFRRKSI